MRQFGLFSFKLNDMSKTIIPGITASRDKKITLDGDIIICDPALFIDAEDWGEIRYFWEDNKPYAKRGTLTIYSIIMLYQHSAPGKGRFTISSTSGTASGDTVPCVSGVLCACVYDEEYHEDIIDTDMGVLIEDFDGTISADKDGNFGGTITLNTE